MKSIKWWLQDHWMILVALALVAGIIGVVLAVDDPYPGLNPAKSDHAKQCLDAGNTIRKHNSGGRDQSKTYWCVDSDQRITDIWWS